MAVSVEVLEPTRALALKVWWAFTWRVALGAVGGGFLAGMLIATVSMALNLEDPSAASGLIAIVAMGVVVWVSTEVMYRILKKKFKGFSITLVKTA